MTVTIKELTNQDIEAFYDLCREMAEEGAGVSFARITEVQQAEELLHNERYYLLGAFAGDKLVGAFQARRGEKGKDHSCHIAGAVTKEWRHKGIGKKMLEHAENYLKHKGMWVIRAEVYSNNFPSIASLLAAGFTWAGTKYKHQWNEREQDYVDDLIFHKDLRLRED